VDLLAPFGKHHSLPISNPLGMPISNKEMRNIPSVDELIGLKIIAEINKLGPAPRAYSALLQMAEKDSNNAMEVDEGVPDQPGRLLIRERFEKIERARPAIPQVLLKAQEKLDQSGLFTPSKSSNIFKQEGQKENQESKQKGQRPNKALVVKQRK